MPPTLADRLDHILIALNTIEHALAQRKPEDLRDDLLLRLAIERSYEIICEAAHRIPDDIKKQQPQIDWRAMVDFGNRLRHAYHRIEPSILWEIAHRDLPPLKAFAERIIGEAK